MDEKVQVRLQTGYAVTDGVTGFTDEVTRLQTGLRGCRRGSAVADGVICLTCKESASVPVGVRACIRSSASGNAPRLCEDKGK